MAYYPKSDRVWWTLVDFITDISFIMDLLLNFFMAFHDFNGTLITQNRRIAINYLTSWFFIDLASSIPFSFILQDDSEKGFISLVKVSRLPKLGRLLRLFKLIRSFRLFKKKENVLVGVHRRYFSILMPAITRLVQSLFVTFVIIHIISCFWTISATYNDQDPDNWITRLGYQDTHPLELYVAAIYWTSQTVFTVVIF